MSDSVNCEKCGKEGRRRRFYPCPESWWWIEVKVEGVTMMGHACSVACKDALWQEGPGKRWTGEEIEKTLAEEPEWPRSYGHPVPACPTCSRPVWDGGHALNEKECYPLDGEICQLHAKLNAARAEIDMLRGVGCDEDGDGPCGACLKCARRSLPSEGMKAEYDFGNAERGKFYRKTHQMRNPEETIRDLREALKEATQPRNQEIWDKLDQLAKTLLSTAQEIDDRPIVMWLGALVESDAEKYEEKYGHRTKGHTKAADFIAKLLKFPTDELDKAQNLNPEDK